MNRLSSLYPNLPGFLAEFKDGGMELRTDPTPPTTESILILGTSVDGPVMEPVAIDSGSAEIIFGKDIKDNGVPNGSTLLPAFKQAWDSGCRDIRLMRVTGSEAKLSISKPSQSVTEDVRVEEPIGVIAGNDDTMIELSNSPLVIDSCRVFAKGVLLSDDILVNETEGIVYLGDNVCDAGAELSISYNYFKTTPVDEKVLLDATFSATASLEVHKQEIVVKVGGIAIAQENYTLTGRTIKVDRYDASNNPTEGDEIQIIYTGVTSEVVNVTENGKDGVPFKAATSLQVKTLSKTPVPGTVHLYVNNGEVLTAGAFTVDMTNNTISIKKELFGKGAQISASYHVRSSKTIIESIDFESYFGGTIYNQGSVEVADIKDEAGAILGKKVIITKPDAKKNQVSEAALVYTSKDYPTFGMLVDAINSDIYNGTYKGKTDYPNSLVSELVNSKAYFSGGDDGINVSKQAMFEALSGKRDAEGYLVKAGAYQVLEDYQTDWVVPMGVYADDELSGKNDNFAYELALFCAILSVRNKTTLGAISMKPIVDTGLANVSAHAKYLANYHNFYLMKDASGSYYKDSNGLVTDLGKFLSVVAGPDPVFRDTTLGTFYGNPALSYVAMNTTLLPQSAPTNKNVPGARGLRYRFSNAQLNEITGNRMVTFKSKTGATGEEGGVYCVDGMTAARIGSDYARLTTSKVVRYVVDQLREVADPFIGEPNTVEQQNALASTISKRLSLLKEKGVIVDSGFQLVVTPQDVVLGQAKIELNLVPPQELRRITTVVGLKAAL